MDKKSKTPVRNFPKQKTLYFTDEQYNYIDEKGKELQVGFNGFVRMTIELRRKQEEGGKRGQRKTT